MFLQTRTQEVDGHLCILSRKMNQGLKSDIISISSWKPGHWLRKLQPGIGGWWPPTLQNCLGLGENEFQTISGYSLHRADWSRRLPSFFIFNVQCSNREWGAGDVAKRSQLWERAFKCTVMTSLVGEDMDSLGRFKYRPNGTDDLRKAKLFIFFPFWHVK